MAVSAFKSVTKRRYTSAARTSKEVSSSSNNVASNQTGIRHSTTSVNPDNNTSIKRVTSSAGHRRSNSYADFEVPLHNEQYTPQHSVRQANASSQCSEVRQHRLIERQMSANSTPKRRATDETPVTQKSADDSIHGFVPPKMPKLQKSSRRHDNPQVSDHPEEEKFILAVHADQNKNDILKLSESRDNSELYNIIKAEVLQAVADTFNTKASKLQISCSTDANCLTEFNEKVSTASFGEEMMNVFKFVCKSYADKLEKAEEEVKQLKKRLVEQERKCLDLTNLINDIIPELGSSQRSFSVTEKEIDDIHREDFRSLGSRRPSLDSDAACSSSLSSAELDKDSYQLITADEYSVSHTSSEISSSVENSDGLVLPWLEMEEVNIQVDIDFYVANLQKSARLGKDSLLPQVLSTSCKPAENGQNIADQYQEPLQVSCNTDLQIMRAKSDVSEHVVGTSNVEAIQITDSSLLCIKSTVEVFSERIQFRGRVESGELLLCIGTFQMF